MGTFSGGYMLDPATGRPMAGRVLQGMADRALAAAQRRARTITIDHGPLPLWLADRASLTDAAHGINAASCVVQHMSITCDGTSLARSTLLEVST